MPAPESINDFIKLATKAGLLDQDAATVYLDRLQETDAPLQSPEQVAGCMVRDEVLTRFQAERLLAGRWKGFLLCGKYRLLEPIGSGGMGTVYRCKHVRLGRMVAIKVLPTSSAQSPGTLERFYREARAVAALNHPNIVVAHDIDNEGNVHFLVMEYVEGSSLQAIVKERGPMDPTRAANYIAQAALGLQHANDSGLVHRDIKPANLLLDKTGTVKILDMGLARFFSDDGDELTKEHDKDAVLGTADYLAPEQALNSHDVDTRADIYSLGITFYYLLAGHAPFHDLRMHQKLIAHQMQQPKPITEVRADVPPEMLVVLDRMIAKDPDMRYQRPVEVAEALAEWLDTPLPPPSLSEINLGDGPSESGILAPRGSSTRFHSQTGLRTDTGPATQTAPVHTSETAIASHDDFEQSSDLEAESPTRIENSHHVSTLSDFDLFGSSNEDSGSNVSSIIEKSPPPPPTEAPVAVLKRPWWKRPIVTTAVSIAAFVLIVLITILTMLPGEKPPEKAPTNPPTISPPKNPIDKPEPLPAYFPDSTKKPLPAIICKGHQAPVNSVAISPEGFLVASGSDDTTVRIWNSATGELLRTFSNHRAAVMVVAFSPNGRVVASGGKDGNVFVWDVDQQKLIRTFRGHKGSVNAICFSPDGAQLVSGGEDKTVCVWNMDPPNAKSPVRFPKDHPSAIQFVDFLLDGQRLITASADGTVHIWDVLTRNKLWTWDTKKGHKSFLLDVSPCGRFSATKNQKGELFLCDAHTGKLEKAFPGHKGTIKGAKFTPDGRYLISLGQDQSICLWNIISGHEVSVLGHTAGQPCVLACSQDGKTLATGGENKLVRIQHLPKFTKPWPLDPDVRHRLLQMPALAFVVLKNEIVLVRENTMVPFLAISDLEPTNMPVLNDKTYTIAASPNKALFATGGKDSIVRIWAAKAARVVRQCKGHKGSVYQVRFSPDNVTLGSVGEDGTLRFWDARTGKPRAKVLSATKPLHCLAFSPDKKHVAASGEDKRIHVWDIKTGKEIHVWQAGDLVKNIAYVGNNQLLVNGPSNDLTMWTLPRKAKKKEKAKPVSLVGHRDPVTCLAVTGGKYALSGSEGGEVILWDLSRRLPLKFYKKHKGEVTGVDFVGNDHMLVSTGLDKHVWVWNLPRILSPSQAKELLSVKVPGVIQQFKMLGDDIAFCTIGDNVIRKIAVRDGEVLKTFQGHTAPVLSVDVSPNGRYLLSASGDRTVRLWETNTSETIRTFRGHSSKVMRAVLSADGRWIASSSEGGKVSLWNPETGKKIGNLNGHAGHVLALAFSPDSKSILTADQGGVIRVYDVASQTISSAFPGHLKAVTSLAISPDGDYLLSGGVDKTVRLWSLEKGGLLHTFSGHQAAIRALAISPDGQQAVSADEKGKLMYWSLFPARSIKKINLGQLKVTDLTFFADGKRFLLAGSDKTLQTWNLPLEFLARAP